VLYAPPLGSVTTFILTHFELHKMSLVGIIMELCVRKNSFFSRIQENTMCLCFTGITLFTENRSKTTVKADKVYIIAIPY